MNAKTGENLSELIYHVLHVLLLRKHNTFREKSIDSSTSPEHGPSILHPIVDTLQYQIFCGKTMFELRRAVDGLNFAGIPSTLSFVAIVESGQQLVSLLSANGNQRVGGEAVIRIDNRSVLLLLLMVYLKPYCNRHTLRFTMLSPSTLAAHLSQATVAVSSLPQLSHLLMDEIDRCLLQKICTMGRDICHVAGGIWFVDMDRCVARWEGCAL
jgi:mediator of RNA polymerase II transcription subunit 17